jgi:predicted DCC family thiol-disulfide oxidoreductase YuxK
MDARSYPWTVLYDSDCGFCRWSLGWVLRWDRHGRLRPIPLNSRTADALLKNMPDAERYASWHLVAPDGSRTSAGAAAPHLLRLLPGGRLPAAIAAAAPTTTQHAYAWIAAHRSTFSRLIPDQAKARADRTITTRVQAIRDRAPARDRSPAI